MIIVLPNADASENNIGKVNINEISETTKTILQTLTKYGPKTDQAVALDDFIVAAQETSWWDKLDFLMLPFLAGNVKQIFYDIKSQSLLTTGEEDCLNDDKFVLDPNGGYYSIRTTATSDYITLPFTATHLGTIGFIVLNEPGQTSIATDSPMKLGVNNIYGDMNKVAVRPGYSPAIDPTIDNITSSSNSLIFSYPFFIGMAFDRVLTTGDGNSFTWYHNQNVTPKTASGYQYGEYTSDRWYIGKHIAIADTNPLKIGMLFHASVMLTSEEMASIRGLITTLVDSLGFVHN